MKIGLIDVDGHNGFPNLALMKLAAFHRAAGDNVEWVNFLAQYDRVYQSKVFTFTPDVETLTHAGEIVRGGTGYGMFEELFCEDCRPDLGLYPRFKHALGFLTRGCIRHCPWCIVPRKEGNVRAAADIEQVLQGRKSAVLMDNNILAAGDYGLEQLQKIIRLGCRVDFNQGLDARLVTDEATELLAKIKWIEFIRMACDTDAMFEPVQDAVIKLKKRKISPRKIFVYVLVSDVHNANTRVEALRLLGVTPFAQPYRDFNNHVKPTDEQRRFARYVNHKAIFNTVKWDEYRRRGVDKVDGVEHSFWADEEAK